MGQVNIAQRIKSGKLLVWGGANTVKWRDTLQKPLYATPESLYRLSRGAISYLLAQLIDSWRDILPLWRVSVQVGAFRFAN